MKRVVLACTPSHVYDFFLPIAARLWKKRIGYEPLILLVGTSDDWNRGSSGVPFQAIKADGHRTEFVDRIPGVDDSNVCMSSRQHAAALTWLDINDILLIGDVDLFPIRRDFYHQHDPERYPVAIYHADMYQDTYWPSYGLSMSVASWRATMGLRIGDLKGSLVNSFDRGGIWEIIKAQKANYLDSRLWTFDETYASERVRASRREDELQKIPSHWERLCRNTWPVRVYASNYIDCHCPRLGYTENWPKIRSVLAQIMPDDLSWVDGYVNAYRSAMGFSLPGSGVPLKAERSKFDSDVFECNVGILRCGYNKVPRKFSIQEANRSQLDVVFVKADGWQVPSDDVSALDYIYEMELQNPLKVEKVKVVKCDFTRPSHTAIAKGAFSDSRFFRDERLARKVEELYERWLTLAEDVYALDPVVNDAFMIVTTDPDGAGRIALLAVHEKSRGVGLGELLVNGVISKLSNRQAWRVKVSSRNVRAIKFYEKLGFLVKSVHTTFHVWTGDEG